MKNKMTKTLCVMTAVILLLFSSCSEAGTTGTPPANTSETQTQKAQYATLTVSCGNAVKYKNNNPGTDIIIPKNTDGVIAKQSVPVSDGDKAMALLKKMLSSDGIGIEESGGYIKGIGGLFEQDCGGMSGWLYSVNGESPTVSADKYTVSDGDSIIFYYITSYDEMI